MVTYIKNQLSDCTTVAQRDKIVLSEMCEQVKLGFVQFVDLRCVKKCVKWTF